MKLMRNFITGYLFIILLILLYSQQTKATTKYELPYEVTNITAGKDGFEIKGWGFIIESQHFLNVNTHSYQLLLYEDGHLFNQYPLELRDVDQSELMRMAGKRDCRKDELNKQANICNYLYKNVGFSGIIPYDTLRMNHQYEIHLEVYAKQSNQRKEIPLFYPINDKITHRSHEFKYQAISDLYATSLKVTYSDVYARKKASFQKEFHKTSNICSYTYGNALYFRQNAIFKNIYERKTVSNTTFYRVKGTESVCEGGFRRLEEGTFISPLWIASSFVDYTGIPLTIHTTIENNPPTIYFDYEPILYANEVEKFDFKSIVHAKDIEDGNLDDKVTLISGLVLSKPGNYELTYYVEDKYHASDTKVMHVIVKEPLNNPPVIHANDHVIYQYEPFDYLKDVIAIDKEDGVITHKLSYTESVNTYKLGTYPVTYTVVDSKGSKAIKTIQITVIRNPKEGLRYFSRKFPWHQQDVPINWKNQYIYLMDQLHNHQIYYESTYDRT